MARSGIPLAPPSLIGASRALVVQKDAVGLRRILFKDRSITHTEHVIHAVVRVKNPGALPPVLRVMRVGPNELVLQYVSARRMCALAMGIAEGMAAHFGEKLDLQQERCMLRGDPECTLRLKI